MRSDSNLPLRPLCGDSCLAEPGTTQAPTERGDRMYGLTRATTTLIAAGAAGLLIWIATQINDKSLGGFWAVYGLIAGAGLVMALSQLLGGWTKWGWPRLAIAF